MSLKAAEVTERSILETEIEQTRVRQFQKIGRRGRGRADQFKGPFGRWLKKKDHTQPYDIRVNEYLQKQLDDLQKQLDDTESELAAPRTESEQRFAAMNQPHLAESASVLPSRML